MEEKILMSANQKIRKGRPKIDADKVCDVFTYDNLLEIGFLSKQCSNDAKGSCIMCDYGCANGTRNVEIYLDEMRKIMKRYDKRFDHLLLCTNGSFMDSLQISDELFLAVIQESNQYDFTTLEIETHYGDVTKEKLDIIKRTVKNKEIWIEMGLETVNEYLHDKVIMKNVFIAQMKEKIDLIHSYGYRIDLNAMIGMPFLSMQEQLEDTLKTSAWIFNHDCNLIVFPVNIKPYTLLFHMYERGCYKPISHWLMIELLNRIPKYHLDKITVAWFGNREEVYEECDKRTVFPTSCPICRDHLFEFYSNFNSSTSLDDRKK